MNLLMVTALLLQDKSGEDTFQKMEEMFGGAKSLIIKFRAEVDDAEETPKSAIRVEGTLMMKEGNKVRLSMKVRRGNEEVEQSLISNGTRMRIVTPSASEEKETPKNLRTFFNEAMSRYGISRAFSEMQSLGAKQQDPKSAERPSKLRGKFVGRDGREDCLGMLGYTIELSQSAKATSARVLTYYVRDSLRLVLRRLSLMDSQSLAAQGQIEEIYDEFTLNAEIPDEKFKLPEEKK